MNRPSRIAALLVAAVVMAGPSLAAPARTLAARGQPIIISQQLVIKPNKRGMVVCQDEIAYFNIDLYRDVVYRYPSDRPGTRRHGKWPPAGVTRIETTSSNPSVATVLPPFKDISAALRFGQFKVIGDEDGATDITIQDTAGVAQPKRIHVVTTVCAIHIKSTSNWNMNFNYALTAWGTMGEVTLQRSAPNEYIGQGSMKGHATAVTIGGCVPRYDVSDSLVTITARVRETSGKQFYDFEIDYQQLTATVKVTCRGIPGGTKGTGVPDLVRFETPAFKTARIVKSVPHAAQTDFGSQPGSSEFVVWTESVAPPPPP